MLLKIEQLVIIGKEWPQMKLAKTKVKSTLLCVFSMMQSSGKCFYNMTEIYCIILRQLPFSWAPSVKIAGFSKLCTQLRFKLATSSDCCNNHLCRVLSKDLCPTNSGWQWHLFILHGISLSIIFQAKIQEAGMYQRYSVTSNVYTIRRFILSDRRVFGYHHQKQRYDSSK